MNEMTMYEYLIGKCAIWSERRLKSSSNIHTRAIYIYLCLCVDNKYVLCYMFHFSLPQYSYQPGCTGPQTDGRSPLNMCYLRLIFEWHEIVSVAPWQDEFCDLFILCKIARDRKQPDLIRLMIYSTGIHKYTIYKLHKAHVHIKLFWDFVSFLFQCYKTISVVNDIIFSYSLSVAKDNT